MAPLTQCPHCDAELPDASDAFCPDCRSELIPDAGPAADLPLSGAAPADDLPLRLSLDGPPPAPAEVPATPAAEPAPPEAPSAGASFGVSIAITVLLGLSMELVSHKSLGAMLGNGGAILLLVVGALVIHAIRSLLCGGDRNVTGLGLAAAVFVIALYTYYDERWFAARRPWNLILATLFLSGGGVVVTGYVFALLRMFESKSERAMAKTCLGLGPAGLGILLAMAWGWRALFRNDSPIPKEKQDRHLALMCGWSAALVVQLVVLGYVWTKASDGRALLSPVQEPPIKVYTEPALRNEKGLFHRVRLVNTSDKPLHGVRWAAFTGEDRRVKDEWRRYAQWESIPPIPPGGHFDLPRLYDAGWVFELDAGELGVKVHELKGR